MPRAAAAIAALAGLAPAASATWSIVLIDVRTGEVAAGSATCLTNFDLQANTPVLIPGVGAATAQSFVDTGGFNRVFIRDRLLEHVHPDDILAMLSQFDSGHQTRQYGMADTRGGVATFTGAGAGDWAGGVTGRVGDVVYAVQGNVLAGDPVVLETEQVIVTALAAGLDLAETLMLGMEEARVWGGDGRCSCGNDADACGSPPDGWDPETGKSAHIAYMLIARAGDGFGCNAIYRVGTNAWGVAQGDFDEDGMTDAAAAISGEGAVAFLRNSALHPGFVTLAPAQLIPASGTTTGIDAADFNNDGHLDIVYTDQSSGVVGLLGGRGDGTFELADFDLVGGAPTWVATGDFNGDGWADAAASIYTTGTVVVMLNDGAGGLDPAPQLAAGVEPWHLLAAEIDGQPGIDLAVADREGDRLFVFANDGAGQFSQWQALATLANPLNVAVGDFDGDGRTDLATADRQSNALSVYRQTAPGSFVTAAVGAVTGYTAVEGADINGDGLDDLVAANATPGRLTLLLGAPGADPQTEGVYPTGTQANDITVADFNADGRPDVLHNLRSSRGVTAVQGRQPADGHGFFSSTEGCATADYYAEFNVAFQTKLDPDPVAQLHDIFDAWRTDLLGLTDAVRSAAALETDRMPAGSATRLTVTPMDWQPAPLGPGLTVWARHANGSAGLTEIGPMTDNGDGSYTIELSGADLPPQTRGTDFVEVVVQQGDRQVILMPSLALVITGPAADWNGDGAVNTADLLAYLGDWAAGELAADLTGDGLIDTRDAVAYLRLWAGQ